MHVGVFADLEGSFGIWRMRQCNNGTPEWQYGRECLTADVNHAVAGALDGGADLVTVRDTHATGFNIITQRLHPRARYIGGHYTGPTFFGSLSDYDLIFYIAIHAAAGTPKAFFPHTHYGVFSELRVNGEAVCEMDLYGPYMGEHGARVGLVSGEEVAVEQALASLPWAKSVTVDKRKETYFSGNATVRYLKEGRAKLRQAAAEAVRHAGDMRPLVLKGPFRFEAEFRRSELADTYNTWGFKRTGRTVEWDAQDMTEGLDELNKLVFFPKRTYPIRGLLALFYRNRHRIKTRWFAPEPRSEGAIRAALEPPAD